MWQKIAAVLGACAMVVSCTSMPHGAVPVDRNERVGAGVRHVRHVANDGKRIGVRVRILVGDEAVMRGRPEIVGVADSSQHVGVTTFPLFQHPELRACRLEPQSHATNPGKEINESKLT